MKKPNIILITLDALRADHLGFMGYGKNTSPFLDSFVKKSVFFKNAFSTGSATPQSFAGIMSSTYPLDFGGYSREAMGKRTLVSEVFRRAGYLTFGFHSNAYLSEYFGYGRGWDVFRYLSHFKRSDVRPAMRADTWQAKLARKIFDWENKKAEKKNTLGFFFVKLFGQIVTTARKIYLNAVRPIPPYYTALEMNEAVKKELKGKPGKPLFLWVHYMDAHDPYGFFLRKGKGFIPKIKSYLCDYMMTFFGEYPKINRLFGGFYLRMYDEGIRNIDNALEELFGHLSEIGVLDGESAIFITTDHGEEFGDHSTFIHTQKAFNENLRVPLVVSAPEKFAGQPGKKEIPRSLLDLAPTMLAFAGLGKPESLRGKNMFDKEERDIIAELSTHEADLSGIRPAGRAIIAEGYKLISMKSDNFLFSLADIRENNNLFETEKNVSVRLENRLKRFKHL